MSEKYKVTITQRQGQALLIAAVSFKMPEQLGDDPVPYMERRDAEIEVLHLYRELKPLSPLYLKDKKHILFGPSDNWKQGEVNIEGKMVGTHELKDQDLEVNLTLDEDAYLGAERILQIRLHSASGNSASIWEREDVLWPLAARLRLTKKLRRLLKLGDRQKRRLELDDMLSNEEEQEDEVEQPELKEAPVKEKSEESQESEIEEVPVKEKTGAA